mgnify:CR=1 FL=1
MRIALVEDDQDQSALLQQWLQHDGHDMTVFRTGKSFIANARRDTYDLIILDWVLPDLHGDHLLSWVREQVDWQIPVIFTTARDSEQDIVKALEAGADDYMVKPLKRAVLSARLRALARRSGWQSDDAEILEYAPYRVDLDMRSICVENEQVVLTEREFDLAVFMFRNQGRILSRNHILEVVWGQVADINTRTVDTHISRLRNKLKFNDESGWMLRSIYQHGYRLHKMGEQNEN